jgi:hypothetical protein
MIFFSENTVMRTSNNAYSAKAVKVNIAEGVDRKQLLSHYDFRKEIALNWLDSSYKPRTHQIKDAPSKKMTAGLMSRFPSPSSVSTITTTTSSSRAAFCTDTSLSENGLLQCRLDTTLTHLPSRKRGNRPQCALHSWTGIRKERDILYCRSCNIHLCVDCYEIFHTRSNLVATKEQLTIEYKG